MDDPGWRMFVQDNCRIMAGEPWGMREFGLRTVDGHRIMIGHELADR